RTQARGPAMAGVPGGRDVDRHRDRDAVQGNHPDAREDVRVAPLLRRQARGDGRAHRALRPAPRARRGAERPARRDRGIARYPRGDGHADRRTVREGHEHDPERRADRTRIRTHRRAAQRARRVDPACRDRTGMTAAPLPAGLPLREPIDDFAPFGVLAFTTTRAAGDFGLGDAEPPSAVLERWRSLHLELRDVAPRLVSARQVHGTRILEHGDGWEGWLRADGADGHATRASGVACAVTVADCVPVFIAHPLGAVALFHAGWRGTAARIVAKGIERLVEFGLDPADLKVHLGPAIC